MERVAEMETEMEAFAELRLFVMVEVQVVDHASSCRQ